MKRLIAVMLCLSFALALGCSEDDRTKDESSEVTTYPITLPLDPEVSQSLYEASVSEEESLNEEAARWDAVGDVMAAVCNSKEFLEADDDKKAEIVINAMKELSEHGTEKYPESLIIYDSWKYYPEYQEVDAQYYDGVSFVISWYDYNAASTVVTN